MQEYAFNLRSNNRHGENISTQTYASTKECQMQTITNALSMKNSQMQSWSDHIAPQTKVVGICPVVIFVPGFLS